MYFTLTLSVILYLFFCYIFVIFSTANIFNNLQLIKLYFELFEIKILKYLNNGKVNI